MKCPERQQIWMVWPELRLKGSVDPKILDGYLMRTYKPGDEFSSPLRSHCSIWDIMGFPDDLKLRSSMTLFALISGQDSIFHKVLNAFYYDQMDETTIAFFNGRP